VLLPRQQAKLARGAKDEEYAMSQTPNTAIAVIGIDIGKNSFHVVGHDARGSIVLRQKLSRGQVEARLANIPPCLIGMEACVGAHHLSRKLASLGHDARLMPAKYVRPYSKGQKNDFNDAEAIAEAVQRPTMKFVATKTAEQLDQQALHRVRERLVSQAPASSTRFAPSCWNAGSPCARVSASCVRNCPRSLRRAPMPCRHACCVSSRSWQATGAGWISASMASPARSKHWPVKIRHVRA
jgi:hypothetical protein